MNADTGADWGSEYQRACRMLDDYEDERDLFDEFKGIALGVIIGSVVLAGAAACWVLVFAP